MAGLQLELVAQGITILGGVVASLLAGFQIIDTYLDIKEKLRKRRTRGNRSKIGKG